MMSPGHGDAGRRLLTPEAAQQVFAAIAARRDEIAFRYLAEGCECRAQLMIEHLQAMGLEPGRAWAVSVGRPLVFPNPSNPKQTFKWGNHVAPTVPVECIEHGVLVIDPSTQSHAVPVGEWAAAMTARSIEVLTTGWSQAKIQELQADRALKGEDLDAVVFCLGLGQPPIPERGGSGFRLDADPTEGPSAFARRQMQVFLLRQAHQRPARP